MEIYSNLVTCTNPAQHKDGEGVENGWNHSGGDQAELRTGRAAVINRHKDAVDDDRGHTRHHHQYHEQEGDHRGQVLHELVPHRVR